MVLFWTKLRVLVWSIEHNAMNAIKLTCYFRWRNCRFLDTSLFDFHLVLTVWRSVTRINRANIVSYWTFSMQDTNCKPNGIPDNPSGYFSLKALALARTTNARLLTICIEFSRDISCFLQTNFVIVPRLDKNWFR